MKRLWIHTKITLVTSELVSKRIFGINDQKAGFLEQNEKENENSSYDSGMRVRGTLQKSNMTFFFSNNQHWSISQHSCSVFISNINVKTFLGKAE